MDDSTLIEQIQLGSKDAFKQMFIKFYSPLCEYASQYVSDEDAEELIQELMLFEILSVYLHQASLPQCDQKAIVS